MDRSPKSTIRVGKAAIGEGAPTYVVAEMACAHEADVERAKRLVDVAAGAKADAIQLQIFSADRLASPLIDNHRVLKKLEVPTGRWPEILSHAKRTGLHVWVNVFDEEALQVAIEAGVDGLKLHSSDLSNPRMLDAVAKAGKPVSLAVGGSTLDEIAAAIDRMRQGGAEELLLMHGYQGYPTLPEDGRLRYIGTLKRVFGCPVGYQDHTDGGSDLATILALVAIGAGACVLEKHFIDDRSLKGTDHHSSLDPGPFARFVQLVREVDVALGDGTVRPLSEGEAKYRKALKKSLVAACEIRHNEVVGEEMLVCLRSEAGLSPMRLAEVVGRKAKRDIGRFEPIEWEMLE